MERYDRKTKDKTRSNIAKNKPDEAGKKQGNNINNQDKNKPGANKVAEAVKKFSQKQKEKLANVINNVVANVKPNFKLSNNYKNFINNLRVSGQRKLMKKLPVFILALTVLAVRNKRIIKPMIDAYKASIRMEFGPKAYVDAVMFIITQYFKNVKDMGLLEGLEIGVTTASMFIEDIPAMFSRVDNISDGVSSVQVLKNILANAVDLKKAFGPGNQQQGQDKPRESVVKFQGDNNNNRNNDNNNNNNNNNNRNNNNNNDRNNNNNDRSNNNDRNNNRNNNNDRNNRRKRRQTMG
jgi:hypothetical protein